MSIQAIAGLGNPGRRYEGTRHNIGFQVVDALVKQAGARWKRERQCKAEASVVTIGGRDIKLIKPMDFMNNSGKVVGTWCRYHRVATDSLAVVYDDITLDPGRLKISVGGSAGGHNGVADLLEHLGNDFVRARIGIGKKPHPEMDLADFVLSRFQPVEAELMAEKTPNFVASLISLVEVGPVATMNQFNQKQARDDCSNQENL